MFDIRQLEAFAAVMSAGSITGAARLLGRSQPAVTRLIQELEAGVGFKLFRRNGPRIAPTDRAVLFHEEIDGFLAGLSHVRERAIAIATRDSTSFDAAGTPAMCAGLLPAAIAKIANGDTPKYIHLRTLSAEQVIQAVLARTADIGMSSLPVEHTGLELHWIGRSQCVAVLAEDDPLAAESIIRLDALSTRRIIRLATSFRVGRQIDLAFAQAGFTSAAALVTNASLNAIMAARSGLGVAVVDPVTATGVPVRGVTTRLLDLEIPFLFGVFTAAGKPLAEPIATLIDAIDVTCAGILPSYRRHSVSEIEALRDAVFGRVRDTEGRDRAANEL